MAEAVEQILSSVSRKEKVTVYGDFDVDGVAATSILVTVLRQIGAECDWFIPDRISEGYGLNSAAIESLASRGTGLLITVDCGVTAVDEVVLARSRGMEVIVTDHHRPEAVLPDCRILHPEVSNYPFKELCGAAVASKLATALRRAAGLDPAGDEADLDLVALATVADVMPLVGENRRLVREGTKVTRRARRPGMKALIAESGLQAAQVNSTDFGFRLGPRINAAGRIYRADAGVELFLAGSDERAREIASELGRANNERRRIEREVETAAEAARRELPEGQPPAIVVAGDGWHPGVVGIVASRLVRKHGVPAVVISIDGDTARGSARGVPGLDLLDAITEAAGFLEGYGGHAAAAGLQIQPARIEGFREALGEAVLTRLGPDPVSGPEPVDAVAGGAELALALAEEFEKLEPFGKGNPSVRLLIPGARITDLREMGDGKHCRFSVVSGDARAAGVTFNRSSLGVDEETTVDILAELNVNHWNGSTQPQLLIREVTPVSPGDEAGPESNELAGCEPGEWWQRFEAAMEKQSPGGGDLTTAAPTGAAATAGHGRAPATIEGPAAFSLAELITSGEPLLVITADARRRWRLLGGPDGLRRLRPGSTGPVGGLWAGSPGYAAEAFGEILAEGVGLSDHATLAGMPDLVSGCATVIVFDPAASERERELAESARTVVHLRDPAGTGFAEMASAGRHALTAPLRTLYRNLRDKGECSGEDLRQVLAAPGADSETEPAPGPEQAAVLLRVLVEAGLARSTGESDARSAGIVSSEKVDLARSTTFSWQTRVHEEQVRFLRQSSN
jgi:single-stranded-DNA-specific exonuclease